MKHPVFSIRTLMGMIAVAMCLSLCGCAEQRLHDAVIGVHNLCSTNPYMLNNGCVVTNVTSDDRIVKLYVKCPDVFFQIDRSQIETTFLHDFFTSDSKTVELYRALCGYDGVIHAECSDMAGLQHDVVILSPAKVREVCPELKE